MKTNPKTDVSETSLSKKRILVVEDNLLLNIEICAEIEDHGGVVIGPAFTLAVGFELLRSDRSIDGAIPNIQIGREVVYPLADALMAAGIPVIFASSESRSSIPAPYAEVPLLAKPIDMMRAADQLFPRAQLP